MLETIEQVFSYNLKRLRGKATQAAFAEKIGVPLRTYQHFESGGIVPQGATRQALAQKIGVGETALFLDPDLVEPTPGELIEYLRRALDDDITRATIITALSAAPKKK